MNSINPLGAEEPVTKAIPSRPSLLIGLIAIFLAMIVYGFLIGNVFETYENGSNL